MSFHIKAPVTTRRPKLGKLLANCHARTLRRMHHAQLLESGFASVEDYHALPLPAPTRLLRYLIGGLCLYVTALILLALVSSLQQTRPGWRELLGSNELWYGTLGLMCWQIIWRAAIWRKALMYLYVMAHEYSHALAIWLCRGRVLDVHITPQGGHVTADKDNVFIALAPYMLPFWALLWLLLLQPFHMVWPGYELDVVTYLGLGFLIGFHFSWTAWTLRLNQPDIRDNGTFFSLSLLLLANVCWVLLASSLNGMFSWPAFVNSWLYYLQVSLSMFIPL